MPNPAFILLGNFNPTMPLVPTVKNGTYQWDGRGFSHNGTVLHAGHRLSGLRVTMLKSSRFFRMNKPDLLEHFWAYGIECPPKTRVDDMREMLIAAAKNGQCEAFIPEVEEAQTSLLRGYQAATANQRRENERAWVDFQNLVQADPAAAAESNPEQFVRLAFLSADDRTPDYTITPRPVLLLAYDKYLYRLRLAVSKVPGLCILSKQGFKGTVVVVGWNQHAVQQVFDQAVARAQVERRQYEQEQLANRCEQERQMDQQIDDYFDDHGDLVERFNTLAGAGGLPTGRNLLNAVIGAYMVSCNIMEDDYPDYICEEGMLLEIMRDPDHPGRLVGEFDLGLLEGIMRFRFDNERGFRDDVDPGYNGNGRDLGVRDVLSELDDLMDDFEVHEEENHLNGGPKRKKATGRVDLPARPAASARRHSSVSGTGPVSAPTNPQEPAKLKFIWRGRETGNGEIDLGSSNYGYIKFDSEHQLSFVGRIASDYFQRASIRGYKISQDEPKGTKWWGEYTERQSEIEKREGWIKELERLRGV